MGPKMKIGSHAGNACEKPVAPTACSPKTTNRKAIEHVPTALAPCVSTLVGARFIKKDTPIKRRIMLLIGEVNRECLTWAI